MYNILLTDDERIMIDSLQFIIKKNFPDSMQIFTCLSGSDALALVAREQIDIIFMDIHMPGLNGLDTLKYITKTKPDTVIIILSAYDQFHYAQEAVNLGVFKYLTKPVNRNVVVETIRQAMQVVDKRRGLQSDTVDLHKKLDSVSSMVESDFIYSAIFGNGKDLSDYFDYFDISGSPWCFCTLEIPSIESKKTYDLYEKIRRICAARSHCIIGSCMLNRIVVFLSFPDTMTSTAQLNTELSELFLQLSISIGAGIRAGCSNLEHDMAKTGEAYIQSLERLSTVSPAGGIAFTAQQEKTAEDPGKIAGQIFGRIQAGDAAMLAPLVTSYCTAVADKYQGNMDRIKNALFELLVNIRNITAEINTTFINDAFENAFSLLKNENNMENLERFIQNRCSDCAVAVMSVMSKQKNPIIQKAIEFINEHIAEDITLEQTAKAVQVSSFYLSKLFKEEKNQNYITYLTDLRMEKARELLQQGHISIKEVSAATGFNDQNYFSRIFRNKFGVTPTEFRDGAKKL